MKPLVSPGLAKACTGLSLIGIVFLLVLSYLFSIEAETLMHDLVGSGLTGKQVAKTCLGAVVIYAVFFLFCGSQVIVSRYQKPVRI
ncbi:hypothetical protein POMI540_2984 [Schizosaccharomyces pombe]|uniref:V-type proton ATPase subunit f n=1 Tax=Schizosaccharomyces pombe (strain 972 / ATCC 24843) TaxID=284812 RepID=RNK_SCHPO|nr:putative ribonuclease kappa-like protein [Schizosaccharomyces pombe]Q8NIQ1.3 RecName: Full=V-type proton ATPase subunit f; Short=V-ATPase subunit f [Schizosaccharomyces pombe 972h-]CAD43411.3 ribonuclease kappa ortholog (predicted) [Schizosaccharomyces pombe]|eukprot:NP_001018267.3 putative ribonuclease kappa-like protein [Schizosaccharomyces pombe]